MKQLLLAFLALALWAQAPPKPASPAAKPAASAAKPAPRAAKQESKAPQGVDAIVALVKGGMSEALVLQAIQREGKSYSLTTADMVKLQQAGASERIIEAMMNPSGGASKAPAAVAAQPEPQPVAAVSTALPVIRKATPKRRLAVMPFDYSAVTAWVHYWFRSDYNVGEGIRAMLTTRLARSKSVVLLERARLEALQKELKMNNTSMVNQGSKVRMGKVSGADCMLLGDIIIFGRDDKSERSRSSAAAFGQVGSIFKKTPILGNRVGSGTMGQFTKEEKAVVAIALRIVETETGEVLETAEARGESARSSKNWDSFVFGNSGSSSQSVDMTSSNFEATIIGEATSDAVDKVVEFLDERIPKLPLRNRSIEGRVAKVSGNSIILGIGANDGVQAGDHFEVYKILGEIVDPVSKDVLDVQTAKVGEFVATEVREKIASGAYSGQPLSETWAKGYTARLIQQ